MPTPAKRHLVNVMRPTGALSARGQREGQDETFIAKQPCNIEPLSGSKPANERMIVPTATHRVTLVGNPRKSIKHKDYLTGGILGKRVLSIEHKDDPSFADIGTITLICEEQTFG